MELGVLNFIWQPYSQQSRSFKEKFGITLGRGGRGRACQDNNKRWMNEWVNIKTTVSRHLCQLKLSYAQGCRKRTLMSQWLTTPKVYFLLTLHVHKGQLHPFFIL